MTKALFQKQLLESFSWVFQDKKTGKNRTGSGLIAYIFLYLFIFFFVGFSFYQTADMMCVALLEANLGWIFWGLMGLMGILLGIMGNVFNTYTSLYQAKDNDLLFSMPIPPHKILITRLTGVYLLGLLYEMVVMVPAIVVYFIHADLNFLKVLFTLLIPFLLSFFVLALSCLLGWVVAWCSSKFKNNKIVTISLALLFFACYFVFFNNSSTILQNILVHPELMSTSLQGFLYPLYHMGLATEGNALSMLIFVTIMLLCFGVVYVVLSRSFIKLATTNRGTAKIRYTEKKAKNTTPNRALLRKEFKRFLGSTNYMLNCGLGLLFMLIGAVILLIHPDISTLLDLFRDAPDLIALVATAGICMMIPVNYISAPSVSLEGKHIWLTQVLPVSGWQILAAKLNMHLILTMIPAAILTTSIEWLVKPPLPFAILIPIVVALFILFNACLGLSANLKFPNLTWTSEVVPIKQSTSVMIAMFGGWAVLLLLGMIYFLLINWVSPLLYLLFTMVLLLIADSFILRWLKSRGAQIFESL